ncbi:hypothetical protein BJV82DRAFT_615796 [Fennellomyces sp. T-0311]|nr:hypothetical protein BJV82DRAFT_615796 [Fennellomyces sp. T-0311]
MEDRRTAANGSHPPTHIRHGEAAANPSHGSRTLTVDPAQEQHDDNASDDEIGVLRLRGDMSARRPRAIQWDESVVDNEHMNKKKSKSKGEMVIFRTNNS